MREKLGEALGRFAIITALTLGGGVAVEGSGPTSPVQLRGIPVLPKPIPTSESCPGRHLPGYPVEIWVDQDLTRACYFSENYRGPCGQEELLVDQFVCEEKDGWPWHLGRYRCKVDRWCVEGGK